MNDFDIPSSFWEHVEELRATLIKMLAVIVCGIVLSLFFYQDVFKALQWPLEKIGEQQTGQGGLAMQDLKLQRIVNTGAQEIAYHLPADARLLETGSQDVRRISSLAFAIPPKGHLLIERPVTKLDLLVLGPIEGMTATLKLCFWTGLVGTCPLWVYFALQFISPALRSRERSLILPFMLLSLVFIALGFLFAFFVTIPLANQYLYAFNAEIGFNLWSLASYLDYTVVLLLASSLAFELSLILFFLVHLGILSAYRMRKSRRWMIVSAFILGALLTPPDVPSQCMLAIPLIGLYELSILYAGFRERRSSGLVQERADASALN